MFSAASNEGIDDSGTVTLFENLVSLHIIYYTCVSNKSLSICVITLLL